MNLACSGLAPNAREADWLALAGDNEKLQRGMKGLYRLFQKAGNCLGKQTQSTRKLSLQRLTELYGVDPAVPLFLLLRLFWDADERAHPQLALLAALARDPLLRVSPNLNPNSI